MSDKPRTSRRALLGATALAGALSMFTAGAASAESQAYDFKQPAQPLASALRAYSAAADQEIMFADNLVQGRTAPALEGAYTAESALTALLDGTGLTATRTSSGVLLVQRADQGPQGGSAGGDVDALIVTAQKREENIQDVPIAISAFSQEDLTRSQIAGGPDLMTQVPNMTFTKTNFSSYSIQIRGIGTQAISATTDPGVAVAFNNTPFIRNRFFEQEFYDLQRVEVLRGPQGTLYGRNATAGVVNIISAKPSFRYEGKLSADVSNYNSTRLEGMVNLPLVEDAVALRLAGAWTKRDGFVTNEITGNPIDGRDLWSTRMSLRFAPNDRIDANLIWEHFQEDDDRLRSGKQLCKTDEVTEFTATFPDGTKQVYPTTHYQKIFDVGQSGSLFTGVQSTFSQGCTPNSLYDEDSFQTVNGLSVPYYVALSAIGLPTVPDFDPYLNRFQSKDLRVIESTVDPDYRAKTDTVEFQVSIDLTPTLTLASESAWSSDTVFSKQDLNRFNTAPGAWGAPAGERPGILLPGPNGGIFCDPQIGCADRLVAVDVSSAKSRHFSQEFRLGSDFDGPFNFSLGANFLRYDTEDKYYVFINSLSLISASSPFFAFAYGTGDSTDYVPGVTDNRVCLTGGPVPPDANLIQPVTGCYYLDPNPIGSLNDRGHNYFLSRNPYKLISYAVFGEAYYNVTDNLKVTAGLRWTVDKKEAPTIPSWILAANSVGYPITGVVEQEWREPTGRLTVDWKPDLSFTDETLLYASYAHGYKAGGANPPPAGPVTYAGGLEIGPAIVNASKAHPKTFEPEFVNAFEIGAKNTMFDGRVTLNLTAFYYDYTGYQISQIIDRSAVNFNFDADIWGLEIEADWRPVENLRLGFKGGYENTRVADGESAIDIMDRTAGHDDWVVVRPFPTLTSNCILPTWLYVGHRPNSTAQELINLGSPSGGGPAGCELAYVLGVDPVTGEEYTSTPDPNAGQVWLHDNYPGWDPSTAPNNGEGFDKDLSGNELPNAPNFTATISADYTLPLPHDWLATLHTDLYYQSEAWTRIFNMEGYDKLKAYSNINLAAIFTNEEAGWKVMAYVKNVLNRDSITGAFLFSDDTGLTTNVFLTEPRLYGVRVTKEWTGGPWWTGAGSEHPAGEPYPLTVELGGMVQRHDAPYDPIAPAFMDRFSPTLQSATADGQNQDLDWGDGREVRLTYRPNKQWSISASLRTAKANGGAHEFLVTEVGDVGCMFGAPLDLCPPSSQFVGVTYTDGRVSDREEHTLADFAVGRDVGLGAMGVTSTVSAGLGYAELESTTRFVFFGVSDWQIPDTSARYNPSQHHQQDTDQTVTREFEGFGPTLSWDASKRLFGDEDMGHVDLDWSLRGGVLFGRQKTFAEGVEHERYFDGYLAYDYTFTKQVGPTLVTPPNLTARSESVTVPTFAATVGLSYQVQRAKIGAGYRWERYFNALDAGYSEQRDADRTIDGPYFKLSVGFGG